MQFSPNIDIRYAAALRIYLQRKINKRGVSEKVIHLFKNILLFEIICCKKGYYQTELNTFFDRLALALSAELIKRHHLPDIKVTGNGNGIINRNAIVYMLCLCSKSEKINIKIYKSFIKITADNIEKNNILMRILGLINGLIIKDIKKENYGIFIPFKWCKTPVIKSPDEYDYLFNKLSPLKVFLNGKNQ